MFTGASVSCLINSERECIGESCPDIPINETIVSELTTKFGITRPQAEFCSNCCFAKMKIEEKRAKPA